MVKRQWKGTIVELDRPRMRYIESDGVYPVREDSLLLLESLMERMADRPKGAYLDMGCGTGLCSIAAQKIGWAVWSADRNPRALALTRFNFAMNGLMARTMLTDLFSGIPLRNRGGFDMISFNPPYLSDDPAFPYPLDRAALSGGPSGTEVAFSFISQGGEYLAPDGEMVMVMPGNGMDLLSEVLVGSEFSLRTLKFAVGSDERLTAFSVRPRKTC
jgi:methylase of polypeptide subunit release factors